MFVIKITDALLKFLYFITQCLCAESYTTNFTKIIMLYAISATKP